MSTASAIAQQPATERPAPGTPQRMLRVLHVVAGLELDSGGPPVAILNFIKCSASSGIRPTLLVTVDPQDLIALRAMRSAVERVGGEFVTAPRTRLFGNKAKRWGISLSLFGWLMRHVRHYDVVILHGVWLFSSLAGLSTAVVTDRPCIIVPHGSLTMFDIQQRKGRVRSFLKRVMKKLYQRYSQLFIFASISERSDSVCSPLFRRSVVLYHPILDENRIHSAKPRGARQSGLRVGFLGRLHANKNVEVLLHALADLPPDVTLIIGGDGPEDYKVRLRELAAWLGVERRLVWQGFVMPNEKDAFFAAIDLLVMPSQYESFGLVAAEAMSRAVPCIVSPRTGIAEIIMLHGGGIICEPNPSLLNTVLRDLCTDTASLTKLSAQALKAVEAELGFRKFGDRLRGEYFKLARDELRCTVV